MTIQIGDTIGYAKLFLKTLKTPATDSSWFRRGNVVGVPGSLTPMWTHWKTGVPQPLPATFLLVCWADEAYPNADGRMASLVNVAAIAKVGSARFAEAL